MGKSCKSTISIAIFNSFLYVYQIVSPRLLSPWHREDGSVVTWGMPRGGGDSRKVQAQRNGTGGGKVMGESHGKVQGNFGKNHGIRKTSSENVMI